MKHFQKSKQQIISEQLLNAKIKKVMPEIYACFVLTLKEYYKWTDQDIVDCLSASGIIWKDCHDKGVDMIKWCLDETGINCLALVTDNPNEEKIIFEGNIDG